MFKKYLETKEKYLSQYNTDIKAKDFLIIRSYSTLVGFTVGIMASSISLMTQNNLIAATIIGTAFTIIGHFAPYEWIKVKSKRNNKKLAQELMKEVETLTNLKEEEKRNQLTINDLLKEAKNNPKLTNYIQEKNIKTIEELKNEIDKMA